MSEVSIQTTISPYIQTTISPYTQTPICTRLLLSEADLDSLIAESVKAHKSWKKVPLEKRIEVARKWLEEFEKIADVACGDIAIQMGRPIDSCKGETNGTIWRARHIVDIAADCLAPIPQSKPPVEGLEKYIIKQPLGVICVISPWNYPHLCLVNTVVAALISGNAVILKPAPQTPSPAERWVSTWQAAGLPSNVLQVAHLSQERTLRQLVPDPRIDFVSFTGSVAGGKAVQQAASNGQGFKGTCLELGGNDPAYVREDVNIKFAAEQLVDGVVYNSGQSCAAVERIYVHSAIYDEFVREYIEIAKQLKLGDPIRLATTLGPVVSVASAARIRKQVKDAVALGAQIVLDESFFPKAKEGTALVGPIVLTNVNHCKSIS
nr:aldehyde dehydrogenase [Cryptococcus depauperatus CBS 7855]